MKKQIMSQTEAILKDNGFVTMDYIISLQGPTLILAKTGTDKMTDQIRKEIEKTGMIIM